MTINQLALMSGFINISCLGIGLGQRLVIGVSGYQCVSQQPHKQVHQITTQQAGNLQPVKTAPQESTTAQPAVMDTKADSTPLAISLAFTDSVRYRI